MFKIKLQSYIEQNKDEIYKIEYFVNKKSVPDIREENTHEFFFADDGFTESYYNDMQINKTLLNAEPVKVYLMDKET